MVIVLEPMKFSSEIVRTKKGKKSNQKNIWAAYSKNHVQDTFEKSNISRSLAFGSVIKSETALKAVRRKYKPVLLSEFKSLKNLVAKDSIGLKSVGNSEEISKLFPLTANQGIVTFSKKSFSQRIANVFASEKVSDSDFRKNKIKKVAVILSGGQAAGGHNVITGLYDALKKINPKNSILGVKNGPSGLVNGDFIKLTDSFVDKYRNTGGFDMLGAGRTKIETDEQFAKTLSNCKRHGINSIVIIGGDDSNTNAALLAEKFKREGIQVIGCPKTIDGDLKTKDIEASFGFDTATKVYSNIISNIQTDANSAKKYWHFIKLMGRSASHVALEVALQTHPNVTLVSEEIAKKEMPLKDVVDMIAKPIAERAYKGKNYGTVIIPEGVIEFIPETKTLLEGMDNTVKNLFEDGINFNKLPLVKKNELMDKFLPKKQLDTFNSLPTFIKRQLLQDRDPHGNLPVSQVDTSEFLSALVKDRLDELKSEGKYNGKLKIKFNPLNHFFGYEGRCPFPSNFDANYCYNLGFSAAALLNAGKTGYMAGVKNLAKPVSKWDAVGVPITSMFNIELRNGKRKPVIKKALVDINGPVFEEFAKNRIKWAKKDSHTGVGAIQYFGPPEVTDTVPLTLLLEQGVETQKFDNNVSLLSKIKSKN